MHEVEFHPAFVDDLAEAALYLEEEAGLAESLIADYEHTLERVRASPELFRARAAGHRRANLKTYSYSIRFDWVGSLSGRRRPELSRCSGRSR